MGTKYSDLPVVTYKTGHFDCIGKRPWLFSAFYYNQWMKLSAIFLTKKSELLHTGIVK